MNEKERSVVERELGYIQGLTFGVSDNSIGTAICDSVDVISDVLKKAGVLYDGRDGDE